MIDCPTCQSEDQKLQLRALGSCAPAFATDKGWISDTRRFQRQYPDWRITRGIRTFLAEIDSAFEDAKRFGKV